ncbi:transmembrane channel-like protein 6 [Anguilla anguilla]|uniref:transmembrane channel-like protein 6 n=1 Tax=Anguilla anguilla TaxID=7936 RepID=UPI0015B09DAC|nr:transmembrane channel-like protein 6 [Anguilla anguilla]XP_035252815.1 transmembrane channel-like protein 6 [Anguilla anguilla]
MASDFGFSQDPHHMEAGLESPVDERVVLHSFSPLIKEASPSSEERREAVEMQDLTEEQDGDDQAFLSSSALVGRGRGRLGAKQVNPLVRARWSAATQRVLCSMPSRTIGRSQNAVISQCYNRSVRRLRRQSQPSIRDFSRSARPSIRGYRMEVTSEDEENTREQLVKNLQALSAGDRIRMLRAMPINMTEKSELRKLACSFKEKRPRSSTGISFFSRVKYYVIITLQHGWCSWLSFLQSLQLWQVAVKTIGGRFGTGVLSYFLFLKTLLLFNVFHFFVNGLFLVIPQAVNPPHPGAADISFTGLELLTGGGYFTDTVMFYGYYTNSSLNETCQPSLKLTCAGAPDPAGCRGGDGATQMSYNIPAAYFFTTGAAFFVTCIILVYSMSKSFGQSFHIKKSRSNLTTKVFFSWDFKVIKKSSVKLQAENLCTQLKELLSEVNCRQVEKSQVQRLSWLAVHALAWTMCLASTLACACLVFFFLDEHHPLSPNDEASLLALPALVSSINLLQPGFFNAVAWMEEYDSPSVRAYVAIFRNLLLKVSVLGVLCYHWLGKIAANSKLTCWESYVGQELYRFLLMDFIFTILDTLFGEFLWKLFSQRVLRRQRKPVFDIARNVLELVYGQTLAWLGVLFCPLLPAVQIIKLLLLFYMKKTSLMMNCQAPRRPWRASQMTTFFISLLCFPSFLGAAVCVTYTIWMLEPSAECGPFRKLSTMAMSGKSWVAELVNAHPKLAWLCWVHSHLVENPIFLFVVAGIFLIVTYFHTQVVDGQRKIIVLLQEQIENEGQDKKFLISKLQMAHEEKRSTSSPRQELRSREDSCMD